MSIVDSVENGETTEALELLSEARFRIFDALVEMPGFAFLAIGRPESSGCYWIAQGTVLCACSRKPNQAESRSR